LNEESRPTDAGGHRTLPGVARPNRFRPRFHYELLVCGLRGHELVGTDARTLRPVDAILAREIDGVRWHRCLRCDSWLPIPQAEAPTREHPPEQEEIELPLRGRPLRDKIVLRTIAVDRAVHFLILTALAVAVFLIATDQVDLRDRFYAVLSAFHGGLGGPTDGSGGGIARRIGDLLSQPSSRLHLIGIVLAVYALVEGIEAVGLWMQKRWAEYLTLIATAGLLPFEIYELYERVTALKIVALIVNLAVVAYLLYAKRLFGIRGGAAAEEELRERDMGWRSLTATSPESYGRG
jgi:hypothetical protein